MNDDKIKCPQCGETVPFDYGKPECYCVSCGRKLTILDAVNSDLDKNNTTNSQQITNYIQIAEAAYDSGNAQEIQEYANKILEIDTRNARAWILKMNALDFMGSINNYLRLEEYLNLGEKCISLCGDQPGVRDEVWTTFIFKARLTMEFCDNTIRDTSNIEDYRRNLISYDLEHADDKSNEFDNDLIQKIEHIANLAIELRQHVPADFINSDQMMQEEVIAMANAYASYSEGLNRRFNIYNRYLSDTAIEARRNTLWSITEGLSEELKYNVSSMQINNNTRTSPQDQVIHEELNNEIGSLSLKVIGYIIGIIALIALIAVISNS